MAKMMLINATHPEEVRAAILEDGALENLDIEISESKLSKGNIYKGIVTTVEPSLGACFVNYGGARDGFLAFDDIVPEAYHEKPPAGRRPTIADVIKPRRELAVQVVKDSIGTKGAALTTALSLAGRFLVLMPYSEGRGISRKVDDQTRSEMRDFLDSLSLPPGCGVILRTSGIGQSKSDLNRDLNTLLKLWAQIRKLVNTVPPPALLFHDRDLVVRSLRDYYTSDIAEVWIDDPNAFERAESYFQAVMPRSRRALQLYTDRMPLFVRYDVERQIETIYQRRVDLRSGGFIIIEPTEALTAIDVNSGRSTREADPESTAYKTNLEAAAEIARQLRLRDLGGIVICDFIDMMSRRHDREVERALREALKADKARVQVGHISSNGILELTRQRLRQSLRVQKMQPCPTCRGNGVIASPESIWLSLLRQIESRQAPGNLTQVRASYHFEIADYISNRHREDLVKLEQDYNLKIVVRAQPGLHRSDQEVEFVSAGPEAAKLVDRSVKVMDSLPASRPRPAEPKPAAIEPAEDVVAQIALEGPQEEHAAAERSRRRRRRRRGGHGEGQPAGPAPVSGITSATPDVVAPRAELSKTFELPPPSDQAAAAADSRSGIGGWAQKFFRKVLGPSGPDTAAPPPQPESSPLDELEPPDFDSDSASEAESSPGSAAIQTGGPSASGGPPRRRRRRRGRRGRGSHSSSSSSTAQSQSQ
ncbi:MAG TPA: Rne/Rng family ribonuclease [Acidobacteriota bacterium]